MYNSVENLLVLQINFSPFVKFLLKETYKANHCGINTPYKKCEHVMQYFN